MESPQAHGLSCKRRGCPCPGLPRVLSDEDRRWSANSGPRTHIVHLVNVCPSKGRLTGPTARNRSAVVTGRVASRPRREVAGPLPIRGPFWPGRPLVGSPAGAREDAGSNCSGDSLWQGPDPLWSPDDPFARWTSRSSPIRPSPPRGGDREMRTPQSSGLRSVRRPDGRIAP